MVNVDQAFLKSLDRPIIIWLLSQEPIHGYGIIKELKRLTGRKLTPGFIYPYLNWLEEKGFAVGEWVERNNRVARYYSLTEKGEVLLLKLRELFDMPLGDILISFLPV